ncbi:MAG TPA: tricarballylate utilization 4Fe-4S protein TcuB [Acidobacteriaceae bacterium]|jgi:citrate/tricarballylate utilization protein|nr:tricarballylate utilization 4Fe-4S protein TcuB [Acidobacteriaceae bacterium]
MPEPELFQEANRQLVICNACRYCEGYCAVFPAIVARRDFDRGDILYLSNLCHDCRACYYACMYTPPHEFAINIPKLMAEVRVAGYRRWSWPGILATLFSRQSLLVLGGFAAVVAVLALALILVPSASMFAVHLLPGSFYQVIPYRVMVGAALALCLYGGGVWLRGARQYWSETAGRTDGRALGKPLMQAIGAALTLSYLRGGGGGCYYPGERPSGLRRIYHALTFWGFAATLVSTTLAYIDQDFLHHLPPYAITSLPVLFGSIGGVAIIFGTAGLTWIKIASDRAPSEARAYGMDYAFLVFLGLAALTGEFTLLLRSTRAMGVMLSIHLGLVAGLFITAPYGKFVHFVYRSLALLHYRMEQSAGSVPHHAPAGGRKP